MMTSRPQSRESRPAWARHPIGALLWARGFDVRDVAAGLGTSYGAAWLLLTGRRMPGTRLLLRVWAVFDLPGEDLLIACSQIDPDPRPRHAKKDQRKQPDEKKEPGGKKTS